MPAGATTADFRGGGWFGGDWHARDISVWSLALIDQVSAPPTSEHASLPNGTEPRDAGGSHDSSLVLAMSPRAYTRQSASCKLCRG
jgi:hypothetical protein